MTNDAVPISETDAAGRADIGQVSAPKPESAWRLIAVALGWILLAVVGAALAGLLAGFVNGFVRGFVAAASGAPRPPGSPSTNALYSYLGAVGFTIVLLISARVRGRIIGRGDIAIGLGNEPIARQWLVTSLTILAALYALGLVAAGYKARPDALLERFQSSLWLYCVFGIFVVVVAPLSEELFLRGWLWTGLRRHWGLLLTALVTSGLWLALHFDWALMRIHVGWGFARMIVLIPIAILLPLARHFGRSVRAPFLLHATYNLIAVIAPWL